MQRHHIAVSWTDDAWGCLFPPRLPLPQMRTVLAQMLDALSPPEELMASSRRGPILLPELPDAVNLLEEGRSVSLNLTRSNGSSH